MRTSPLNVPLNCGLLLLELTMKLITRNLIWLLFLGLFIANVYVFISGVSLSDEIHHFEKETGRLHQENLDMEKKVYDVQSLTYAASIAAEMDFSKKATPTYLENMKYALNR